VVKLALNIDKKLGARLAGEVKKDWQKETVALIMGLNLPQFFTILLLGEIRSDDAIPGLLKALEDSDKYDRRKAAAALGNIGSETAIAGLLKALEDSDWNVRGNAAEALGKIGTETAIAGLLKALEDSREYVRGKAAEALGNIGSEAAMAQLINCLKNSDFVTLNDGDTFSASIKALDTIQNKLKYYHPLSQPMNQPSSEKNSPSSSNQSGSSRLSMIN
jgi:HEAT repeat protein